MRARRARPPAPARANAADRGKLRKVALVAVTNRPLRAAWFIEVLAGGGRVVRGAPERDGVHVARPAAHEQLDVVQLEEALLVASPA